MMALTEGETAIVDELKKIKGLLAGQYLDGSVAGKAITDHKEE